MFRSYKTQYLKIGWNYPDETFKLFRYVTALGTRAKILLTLNKLGGTQRVVRDAET